MTVLAPVAVMAFRRHSTYRMATAAAVLENVVVSMLRGFVYVAVAEAAGIEDFGAAEAMTFAFVSGLIESSFWIVIPLELGERIRSGDVITDLYRPVDLQGWLLATEIGRCGFNLLGRGVPQVLVAFIVFDLVALPSPGSFLLFLGSVALAFVVGFSWKFVVALTGFWLLDVRGVSTLAGSFVMVASGAVLPLALLPDPIADVLRWLPPASMVNTPVELFNGTGSAAPRL
ncbi:MAG TPA: ABC-2 family transporter protein, partial [Acidimicrobiales bacterium]|nr:ABC-2 family transporter protein [Acidimicrobiales bacterium]